METAKENNKVEKEEHSSHGDHMSHGSHMWHMLLYCILMVIAFLGASRLGGNKLVPENIQKNTPVPLLDLKRESQGENGVLITVIPQQDFSKSDLWKFEVDLTTHSGDLDANLKQESTLSDDRGTVLQPITWEGDPPGGHHRKGILTFQSIPNAQSLTLSLVTNRGGISQYVRWDFPLQNK